MNSRDYSSIIVRISHARHTIPFECRIYTNSIAVFVFVFRTIRRILLWNKPLALSLYSSIKPYSDSKCCSIDPNTKSISHISLLFINNFRKIYETDGDKNDHLSGVRLLVERVVSVCVCHIYVCLALVVPFYACLELLLKHEIVNLWAHVRWIRGSFTPLQLCATAQNFNKCGTVFEYSPGSIYCSVTVVDYAVRTNLNNDQQ